MRILLVSTYELGHQPLHLAVAAAILRRHGHTVDVLDLAVSRLDWAVVDRVEAMAVSVPMHTAMRLGIQATRLVKERRPELPVAFYGLYSALARDAMVGGLADRVIAGEYAEPLAQWVDELASGLTEPGTSVVTIGKRSPLVPDRAGLPPLDEYAHLSIGGEHRLVGYVEATQGCRHTCRHCPVPAVFGGRFRAIDIESVQADVDNLVGLGARHITFGDPDFLNGPAHATRVLEALRTDHPDLTFDVTVKVEHILANADSWEGFARLGVLFVVSAYETVDDETLRILDKGHTAADMAAATGLLRAARIDVRPTFLPFTPWTRLEHLPALFGFLSEHDLLESIDPIQMAIRLLVPEGSLLLDAPEARGVFGEYDSEMLGYRWESAYPVVDVLQEKLAAIAEAGTGRDEHLETIIEQWAAVVDATGPAWDLAIPAGATVGRPRLTEPWFC